LVDSGSSDDFPTKLKNFAVEYKPLNILFRVILTDILKYTAYETPGRKRDKREDRREKRED